MLSPSRSSSVARMSSSASFTARPSARGPPSFLSGGTTYSGSKSLSTFTPSRAHSWSLYLAGISFASPGRSRTWPIDASTR